MVTPPPDRRPRGHLLDRLETWVESHREELSVAGDVTFRRGPEERDNRSAELVVAGARDVFELVLWESGEVELGQLVDEEVRLEHVDVVSSDDLGRLCRRALDLVREQAQVEADAGMRSPGVGRSER